MSDFNGSSDIENIANVALWLWRPEFWEKDDCPKELKGVLQVYLLKNRWWMVKATPINLWCDMAMWRVFSLSTERQKWIDNPYLHKAEEELEEFDVDSIGDITDDNGLPF